MSLPMGELKALFITSLKQQGYEVPVEFNNFINAAVSKISSRDSSPCMSVCGGKRSSNAISSDEEPISEKSDNTLKGSDEEAANSFKIVKRKSRKAARRQRKNSTKNNSSDESDPTMEVELNHVKKLVHRDSPASPDKDKTKWNFVSAECTRMHINYTRAQNTKQGIRISTGTVEDFRKLNKFLISSNIPFHTFALEEERKIKVVIKGIPLEFETADIKDDLINQGYPVLSVHRMHRRNGTPLGMVLVILERNDEAREIFKNLARVCGLSGVTPEEPYKRGMPSQCHRCQLYGHAAANCFAQPRCVKCLVPHWTKDCERNKESGGKPSCCNCGKDHTANYGGCSEAPRPKPIKTRNLNRPNIPTNRLNSQNQFPPLSQTNRPTVRAEISHTGESAGGRISRPAPPSDINKWKNPLPWVKPKATPEPNVRESPTHPPRRTGAAASALGEDINTIMSILQVVRSAEVADLAAKFRRAKHGVDRLQIILENQELINRLENL
ncbi:Nucleic-acid-binding protein from transposon X-element [Eumeta japonica]|uniref:Nucleic-acid-binding protein from transposon X-element n=1 Tax=Eumeta variegata TaxID=151549 RepID=A0A4C1W1Z3_EUMVA|nr:Nucleic-acid-binding protein from transposon X-element [Eumeta japonica]